jgi:DNA polymerase III sliding clamp (beta) subunit (PCNA family)
MKFFCDSKPLAYALNKCATLTSKSATYPFVRNVFIETIDDNVLKLTSTDMATMITYYVTDGVRIEKPGKALVDCGSLAAFVSAKAGEVNCYTTKADRIMTKIGSNKLSLSQMPHETFPEQPKLPSETLAKISGDNLQAVLSIAFMAEQFDPISFLTGTMIVASDGNLYAMAASQGRIGYAWIPTEYQGRGRFLLPKSAAALLPRFLYDDDEVLLYSQDNKMFFVTDRFKMSCNQLAGEFPYEKIAEMAHIKPSAEVWVAADDLGDALSTALVISKDVNNKLWKKITFNADTDYNLLDLSTAEENEVGYMNWSVVIKSHTNTPFTFGLFSTFVYDVLKAIKLADKSGLATDLMMAPTISIGYIEHGANKLIRIAEKYTNAVFIVAPMGQVEVRESG